METLTTGHSGYTYPSDYNYAIMQRVAATAVERILTVEETWDYKELALKLGVCSQTPKNWHLRAHIPGVRKATGENLDNLLRLYEKIVVGDTAENLISDAECAELQDRFCDDDPALPDDLYNDLERQLFSEDMFGLIGMLRGGAETLAVNLLNRPQSGG
jgi:hypothetical protein